jgi:hypothetical protein
MLNCSVTDWQGGREGGRRRRRGGGGGGEGGDDNDDDHNVSEIENFEDQGDESISNYSTVIIRYCHAEDMHLITR